MKGVTVDLNGDLEMRVGKIDAGYQPTAVAYRMLTDRLGQLCPFHDSEETRLERALGRALGGPFLHEFPQSTRALLAPAVRLVEAPCKACDRAQSSP